MSENGPVLLLADPELGAWPFANRIYEYLANHEDSKRKYLLHKIDTHYHTDGAIEVRVLDSVRGHECYVIHDSSLPPQDWKESVLQYNDALRYADAAEVTDVLPYMHYSRDDKTTGRGPIAAKILAKNIIASGASRVITGDLHNPAIKGFYDGISFENLKVGYKVLIPYLIEHEKAFLENANVVPPDAGAARRSAGASKRLGLGTVYVEKKRDEESKLVTEMTIIGDVKGRNCLEVDDMIATAGTLVTAANVLQENGAQDIYAMATHGLLCKDRNGVEAEKKIKRSPIKKIIISDTIPQESRGKIHVVSCSDFYAEAIKRITHQESISSMYEN